MLWCHVISLLLARRVLRILHAYVHEFESIFLKGHTIFNIPEKDMFGETIYAVHITFCENEIAFLCIGNALYHYSHD